MKIHATRPAKLPIQDYEQPYLEAFLRRLAHDPRRRYEAVDDPETADLIVFLESNEFEAPEQIELLRQEECVARFPNKLFTINYDYKPTGLLPGLYTSLPPALRDRHRHRTWAYLFPSNGKIFKEKNPFATNPRLLFSFRGNPRSHPVRKALAARLAACEGGTITTLDAWCNHTDEQQAEYVREILDSWFVLCPRGTASSSHRLFETMALGRCPVIISDEWVPIEGIDWDRFSLRVPENDLDSIPGLLERRRADAPEMGRRAREVWMEHFSWHNGPGDAIDRLVEILESRPPGHDEGACQAAWTSREFFERNGWPWPGD